MTKRQQLILSVLALVLLLTAAGGAYAEYQRGSKDATASTNSAWQNAIPLCPVWFNTYPQPVRDQEIVVSDLGEGVVTPDGVGPMAILFLRDITTHQSRAVFKGKSLHMSGEAQWSVDQTYLIFITTTYDTKLSAIWRVNPDGSGLMRLTPDSPAGLLTQVRLIPDGSGIVYIARGIDSDEVMYARTDGSSSYSISTTRSSTEDGLLSHGTLTLVDNGQRVSYKTAYHYYNSYQYRLNSIEVIDLAGNNRQDITLYCSEIRDR